MKDLYCTYGRHWVKVKHSPRYDINETCESCKAKRLAKIAAMRQEQLGELDRQRGLRA